jgi:hypothetical protein
LQRLHEFFSFFAFLACGCPHLKMCPHWLSFPVGSMVLLAPMCPLDGSMMGKGRAAFGMRLNPEEGPNFQGIWGCDQQQHHGCRMKGAGCVERRGLCGDI